MRTVDITPARYWMPLLLAIFVVACGDDPGDESNTNQEDPEQFGGELIESDVDRAEPTATDEMLQEYAFGQAEFAIRFLRAAFDEDEDAVFSSYSLAEALTIASTFDNFAPNEVEAMLNAVGIDEPQDAYDASNTFRLDIDDRVEEADPDEVAYANLNDIWVEDADDADNLFDLDDMKRYFGVGVRKTPLDSDTEAGAENINGYIDHHTQGLIPELITAGQLIDVFAVVTTVLYLKASWSGNFSDTGDLEFFEGPESTKEVPAIGGETSASVNVDPMTLEVPEGEPLVASVPLRGGMTFDIIAPEPGTLGDYLADFDADTYHALLDDLSRVESHVTMPTFEIEEKPGVEPVMMEEFGFPGSMFAPGKIGEIIHEAVIDVNEDGIEAAAATAITFADNQDPGPQVYVEVDRPFLYFVRDRNTRMILFSGQYVGE